MEQSPRQNYISLALLPLQQSFEDSRMDMFCTGLAMDLITDLSRFRSFQIFPYDYQHQLWSEENSAHFHEGPDYLVKGLVRQQGEHLVFNFQLIQRRQQRLVWAEKFSGLLEDIFQIQEEILEKIVGALQQVVDFDLLSDIRKKPLTNLNAYECWLKGLQELKKGSLETDEQARVFFQKAIELDPHYARAYTGMSLSYFNEWSCQIWDRWEVSQNGAFEWAQKSLEIDEWDHVSTAILGKLYLFQGEYEKSEHFLRKALRLNPNDVENLNHIALGMVYLGYPDEARRLYKKIRRLNPEGSDICFACGAFAHFELGDYEETIALGEKHQLGKSFVDFPAYLAAAYYLKGDLEKMQLHWQHYQQSFQEKINQGKPVDTQTAVQWMINVNPFRQNSKIKPFWEYMMGRELDFSSAPDTGLPLSKPEANCFLEENGLWSFSFAGKQVQMPEVKGFYDLARLLQAPNTPIASTELMDALVLEPGERVFDEKARKSYEKRIVEIQEELQEAESFQNSRQISALQEEYDQLLDHLSQSLGRGGRTRKTSGTAEKARTAVTWRIRNAIKKIAEVHPELGKHLDLSIKTGSLCSYSPERETSWIV